MLIINTLILLLIPLIFGLTLLSLFLQKNSSVYNPWEKIALAFALGLGFQTIAMFTMAFLKVPLTFLNITIALALFSLISAFYLVKARTFCFSPGEFRSSLKITKLSLPETALMVLIALKVIYVFFETLVKPVIDIDAFQQYTIVAKAIYYHKTFLLPYLEPFGINKPLFTFLAQGWAFLGLHTVNDALVKIVAPMLFLCFLAIFYFVLRRYYARIFSLLFTFLLSTLPFIVYHATTAYSDFPMTFYYATATFYLFLAMKEFILGRKDPAHASLIISFSLLAIAVWTKNAGTVLAGVNTLVLFVFLWVQRPSLSKADLKKAAISLLVFLLAILPWLAYGQVGTYSKVVASLLGRSTTAAVIPAATVAGPPSPISMAGAIFFIFLRKLFLYADWHLTWLLFLVSLVFFYKKSFARPLAFLLAIILIDILALFVQFSSAETFQWLLDGTLLDRLVMNEVPVVLYFCAEAILPALTKSD